MKRAIEVRPEAFKFVRFDPTVIRSVVDALCTEVGLPESAVVVVEVDESTPMGFTELTSLDPISMTCGSGALEDPKRLRELSVDSAERSLGRLVHEASDRARPDFGAPPLGTDLELGPRAAWDAWIFGRLARRGHRSWEPRQRYSFRIRHGFSDRADAVFDQLWACDDALSFADLERLSSEAASAV